MAASMLVSIDYILQFHCDMKRFIKLERQFRTSYLFQLKHKL